MRSNERHGGWIALISLIILSFSFVKAGSQEPIFSEGGGQVPFALEEEILEELAREKDPRNEDKDYVGISSAGKTQPKSVEGEPAVVNAKENSQNAQNRPTPQTPLAPNSAKQQYDELKSAAAAAIMKQTGSISQPKPKQKKEGQEEFPTFVDPFSEPAQNRRLVADKQTFHHTHEEKRAQVGAKSDGDDLGDTVFIAVTTVCSAAAVFGLIGAGVCWYRLHRQYKAAQDVEYPHYGVTGPSKERSSGSTSPVAAMDAKLASSAQLYHYQHTKQQIIAMEHSTSDAKGQESEDSEGEGDEGDFSVYECPGLAPTGDIEVNNPLFENVASPQTKTDPRAREDS